MPINMSIDYPALQKENTELKIINKELFEALESMVNYFPHTFGYNKKIYVVEKAKAALINAEKAAKEGSKE